MEILAPLLLATVFVNAIILSSAAGRTGNKKGGRLEGNFKPGRQSDFIRQYMMRTQYAKSDPPLSDRPTEVKLGIYVNSFYSISEQTMDYSVSFYLRQSWRDARLKFDSRKSESRIRLDGTMWWDIWVPDTFFRNEKRAIYHDVTTYNRLMFLNHTGHVWYVSKISATLSCPMKLQKYPLDTQTCPMMFESFGYTMDIMYFSWLKSPIDIDGGMQLPQFNLQDKILYDCSQNYTGGAYPCLEIRFVLKRDIGYFLIQTYIPTILIVILSWVSFWINVDAIPARVSLGLLTVLTMTTQSSMANTSMPRVSYIKALDVWMSMCLIFVFTALLEFAVVNVISRKGVRTINPLRRPPPPVHKLDAESALDQHMYYNRARPKKRGCLDWLKINIVENGTERNNPPQKTPDPEGKQRARRIDKLSRKAFPLAFLLFNIVYWIFYTLPGGSG